MKKGIGGLALELGQLLLVDLAARQSPNYLAPYIVAM